MNKIAFETICVADPMIAIGLIASDPISTAMMADRSNYLIIILS